MSKAFFSADAYTNFNQSFNIKYVQIVENIVNDANGTGAGWTYLAGNGAAKNSLPIPGRGLTFPAVDGGADKFVPTITQAQGGGVDRYTGQDSPQTGHTGGALGATTAIDLRMYFTMYLVCVYPDDSISTAATVPWDINFWADTNVPGSGVTNIRAPNGITVGAVTYGNPDPPKTVGPYPNNNMQWQ